MHPDSTAGSVGDTAADEALAKHMHGTVSEAAERVTFFRIELERWERIGRAATRALGELGNHDPVPAQTPDSFLSHEAPQQSYGAPVSY